MRLYVYHICRIRSVAKDSFTLPGFSLIIFPVVNVKSPEPDLASKFPCHPRCESFVERFLGLALRAPSRVKDVICTTPYSRTNSDMLSRALPFCSSWKSTSSNSLLLPVSVVVKISTTLLGLTRYNLASPLTSTSANSNSSTDLRRKESSPAWGLRGISYVAKNS